MDNLSVKITELILQMPTEMQEKVLELLRMIASGNK